MSKGHKVDDDFSKRDIIAMLIFAGMHANNGDGDERYAVVQADRLIAELERKQ